MIHKIMIDSKQHSIYLVILIILNYSMLELQYLKENYVFLGMAMIQESNGQNPQTESPARITGQNPWTESPDSILQTESPDRIPRQHPPDRITGQNPPDTIPHYVSIQRVRSTV